MSDGFLWGVSTSGYQSEGGFNGEGQPKNNWAEAEAAERVQRTGAAADFWNRYEEDFAAANAMGCRAFRLGIEWARVQPSESVAAVDVPPAFDDTALTGYAKRIAACRHAGLEPVVTMQHFTHPAWLGADAWLDERTVPAFTGYVRHALDRINTKLVEAFSQPPIHWLITINEPNILVQHTYLAAQFPGGRQGLKHGIVALNHLLTAHVRAYNAIHDLYELRGWSRPMVTTNTFCSDLYWSDQVILDLLSMRERAESDVAGMFRRGSAGLRAAIRSARLPFRGGVFVWIGRALHRLVDFLGPRYFTTARFEMFLSELSASPRKCVFDYVGMDYYDPFAGHVFRPPSFADLEFPTHSLRAWLMDGMTSKWWDWRMLPEGLHFFCGRYAKLYRKPILIAENGMALRRHRDNSGLSHRRDRITRTEFLKLHVREVTRLREEGVPLLGYLHWSLTDNYEWGSFTPRFGLFTIDFATGTGRLAEDHLGDRPSETYARLIAEAEARISGVAVAVVD